MYNIVDASCGTSCRKFAQRALEKESAVGRKEPARFFHASYGQQKAQIERVGLIECTQAAHERGADQARCARDEYRLPTEGFREARVRYKFIGIAPERRKRGHTCQKPKIC